MTCDNDMTWQEWLDDPDYQAAPPHQAPTRGEFSFPLPRLFLPFMPPPEPYFDPRLFKHHGGKHRRLSYHPFARIAYHPYSSYEKPFSPYDDDFFMPKGKPSLMLSQSGSLGDIERHNESLPDEISSLIFDLESNPTKITKSPHLALDDTFTSEYEEMNDLIMMNPAEDEFNDSGIAESESSSQSSSPLLSPTPPPTPSPPPTQPVLLRRNVCQFCRKQYQSISGLKYHLKKAHNECSAKFKAMGKNHPLIPALAS